MCLSRSFEITLLSRQSEVVGGGVLLVATPVPVWCRCVCVDGVWWQPVRVSECASVCVSVCVSCVSSVRLRLLVCALVCMLA